MPELSKVVVSFNSLSMKFHLTVKLRRINERKSYSSHTKDYNPGDKLSEALRAVLSVGRGWHSHVHFKDTGYTGILHKVHQRLTGQISIVQGPSLVAQMVKNLPAVQQTQVQSLYREGPLEKGMATHS